MAGGSVVKSHLVQCRVRGLHPWTATIPQYVTIEAGHCRLLWGVELAQNALRLRIAASASLLVGPHLRSKVDWLCINLLDVTEGHTVRL